MFSSGLPPLSDFFWHPAPNRAAATSDNASTPCDQPFMCDPPIVTIPKGWTSLTAARGRRKARIDRERRHDDRRGRCTAWLQLAAPGSESGKGELRALRCILLRRVRRGRV